MGFLPSFLALSEAETSCLNKIFANFAAENNL
ncbi:unknown [Bacteroides sp. CAG:1076]|nr:unknown [Bacteroides sp. CAG:1076]